MTGNADLSSLPPPDREPDLIVVRAAPELPPGFLPPEVEGRWFDRTTFPAVSSSGLASRDDLAVARVVPTGRFEVREEDGAVAEVYEVRP